MSAVGAAAIIGGAASAIGGIFGGGAARRAAKRAARERKRLQKKLTELENNRQAIINPYEDVKDLSALISNPFANLGVATQAAEIKIEESDLALANTLDTLRATGASAGGATALAQAALRSKKGVAASIESQEAQNEKLRAQGEQQREQQLRSEQMRLQQADVAGKQFVFSQKEQREMQQLNRTAAMLGAATQAQAQAQADQTAAITGAIGGISNIAGSYMRTQ
tara:strand:+ start:327 stop:998 length:672 start_codon:yes stop_codon:yes gene_type:complete